MIPNVYTTKEIAEKFKVSSVTVKRWVKRGILTGSKIGGVLRFSEEEVNRLMQGKNKV